MINLRPLKVTLIDFDISYLRVAMTSGGNKGTPGYYPLRPNLKDGSTAWDAWAVAAIILESDMAPGECINREVRSAKGRRAYQRERNFASTESTSLPHHAKDGDTHHGRTALHEEDAIQRAVQKLL